MNWVISIVVLLIMLRNKMQGSMFYESKVKNPNNTKH
jgi:hypothetical protein